MRCFPIMLWTLLVAVCAPGCVPPPPAEKPPPCNKQQVTLTIFATRLINPNEKGLTRPVVVRLYQLRNDVSAANASYDALLTEDKKVLGTDLVRADEVEVFPNDRVEVKFDRSPEAEILGGVALVQFPRGQSYKTFYQFPPLPGAAACARDAEKGPPQTDPRVSFFLDEAKIDSGIDYDESMFTDAKPIRKLTLPKRSANPEAVEGP